MELVTDQGGHFINETMEALVWEFVIKHQKSTTYYPRCNGQAESTNKTLKIILLNGPTTTAEVGFEVEDNTLGISHSLQGDN